LYPLSFAEAVTDILKVKPEPKRKLKKRKRAKLSDWVKRAAELVVGYFELTAAKLMLVHSLNDTRISACPTAFPIN
jgi:hypothetical protein